MGKGKQLTEEERTLILGMAKGGATISKIAEETKRPRGTVATVLRQFRLRGNVETAKRSGRPLKTSPRDHRQLVKLVKEDRRVSARDLSQKWGEVIQKRISERTTRRRLKSLGYNGRQARKKPFISAINKKKRLLWARKLRNKTLRFWKNVVFTDESKIKISGSDGCVFVWRTSTEEWLPCCTIATVKTGEASLMVWGCITYDGVGPITIVDGTVTGSKYCSILQEHFLPVVVERRHIGKATTLQDDNAPVHRARVVTTWKKTNKIKFLDWPAQSPDLNPIENVWMFLKKAISRTNPPPRTLFDLKSVILKEWQAIPVKVVQNVFKSMPHRLSKVIKAKGFATKY